MPIKILVAAQDLASGWKKGDVVAAYPGSYQWGAKEGLPTYVRLTLTDQDDIETVQNFMKPWVKRFSYSIVNQNPQGYRIEITVDPALVAASGGNSDIKDAVVEFLTSVGTIRTRDPNRIVIDIAKPADLPALKDQLNEFFEEITHFVRYRFSDADVDWAIAHGGEHEMTTSEVLSRIIDRLAE